MASGLVPEHVVPPEHEPDITPVFVMATEPPIALRVELSSDTPVPAVMSPVVVAMTEPFASVPSTADVRLGRPKNVVEAFLLNNLSIVELAL